MSFVLPKHFLSVMAFLFLLLISGIASAAEVGTVTHVSGVLSAQSPDGTIRFLTQKAKVNQGDTLTTVKDSYALINFTDGSSITLRPNSQVKINVYHFTKDKPQEDSLFMSLIKGGMRSVTGLVGKRGNQDAYQIKTSAATVGIRGSSGDTVECSKGCEGVTPTSDKVPRGVYHTTYTGLYIIRNEVGSLLVGPSQFAYVKDAKTPPVLLPGDPGLGLTLPLFSLGGAGGPSNGPGNGPPSAGGNLQACLIR